MRHHCRFHVQLFAAAWILLWLSPALCAGEGRIQVREYRIPVSPDVVPSRDAEFEDADDSLRKALHLKIRPDSADVLRVMRRTREGELVRNPWTAERMKRDFERTKRMKELRRQDDSTSQAELVRLEEDFKAEQDSMRAVRQIPAKDGEGRVFFTPVTDGAGSLIGAQTRDGIQWCLRGTRLLPQTTSRNWQEERKMLWDHVLDSLEKADPEYRKAATQQDLNCELMRDDKVVRRFTCTADPNLSNFAGTFVWGDSCIVEYRALDGRHILINGQDLSEDRGYDTCFEFQIIQGRPFYFFCRGGNCGWYYDGAEVDRGYRQIIYDYCCGVSGLNPTLMPSMFRFYAQRDDGWYLVDGTIDP